MITELSNWQVISVSAGHNCTEKYNPLPGNVPRDFIRNIRLKQAARIFQTGHTNITEVLYSVGFNTPSHFTYQE